jgi:murein DD-endopeptidase MepM/ murein hydrolase activator NlpD
MKDLRSKTPPPLSPPADEPFDFSQSASAASPGAPAGRPLIGPRAPTVTGESDRIVPDRTPLPHLSMPLSGIDPHKIVDTFHDARGTRKHDALDIMAPRGTPVRAVTQGNVAKLFTSKLGGITVYQFDDSRTYCYYYAHLDRYAKGLQDGTLLRAGDVLGYVGSTGDASAKSPHLHFAVFKLGPEKKWWEGTPIDPLPLLH